MLLNDGRPSRFHLAHHENQSVLPDKQKEVLTNQKDGCAAGSEARPQWSYLPAVMDARPGRWRGHRTESDNRATRG